MLPSLWGDGDSPCARAEGRHRQGPLVLRMEACWCVVGELPPDYSGRTEARLGCPMAGLPTADSVGSWAWAAPAAHPGQQLPHLDDVGVLEAWDALILADDTRIFLMAAVTVPPAPVFAVPNALLASSTIHVVQPDPPCQTPGPGVRRGQAHAASPREQGRCP